MISICQSQTESFRVQGLLPSLLLFMTLVILMFAQQSSSETDQDVTQLMSKIRPFRMKKANLLWSYGRKPNILSLERQTELFKELQNFDKLELKLKKLKSQNLDEDGRVEEKSLYTFKRMVERYSLGDHLLEDDDDDNRIVNNKAKNKEKKEIYFEDPTLQEMWKEALSSGLSVEDLDVLKEEFTHQQMKIKEFEMMHNEGFDHHDEDMEMEREIDAKKRDSIDVKRGFDRLDQIKSSMVSEDGEFEDSRLNNLWNTAKTTKWSPEKLDSFKQELHHFEKRINKQKIYADDLKKSSQISNDRRDSERHEFLEKKNHMLNEEVKKYHKNLKKRLSKAIKHNEL